MVLLFCRLVHLVPVVVVVSQSKTLASLMAPKKSSPKRREPHARRLFAPQRPRLAMMSAPGLLLQHNINEQQQQGTAHEPTALLQASSGDAPRPTP